MRSFLIENLHYAQTMRILGLDLSLTSTGWATNGKTGSISVKTKESQRLYDIRKEINRIVEENNVTAVVVEGYAFAARNSQSHKIGELGGVIRLMLFKLGIPYVEVPPTCRAKFATGRGNAAKTEVISAVSARTGIVWSGKGADDEVDAWLLEEMGLHAIDEGRYDWPSANKDAMKTIDWSSLIESGKK
jgi:Holliday junction resolvasome RuvABC endonuclease subunit